MGFEGIGSCTLHFIYYFNLPWLTGDNSPQQLLPFHNSNDILNIEGICSLTVYDNVVFLISILINAYDDIHDEATSICQ